MTIQKTTGGNLLRLTAGSIAKECCCGGVESACYNEDCAGTNNPSIQVTVFDSDYAGGNINWCGKVWTPAEVQAGKTECVCATFWQPWTISTSYTSGSWWENNGLRLYGRYYNVGGSFKQWTGKVGILALSDSLFFHSTNGPGTNSSSQTWASAGKVGTGTAAYPVVARGTILKTTTSPVIIPDEYFFNVTISGVTYKWERGNLWP